MIKFFDMNDRTTIGRRIAELRTNRGLTQQDLADRTGILRNNISRIEAGKFDTKVDTIGKITEALGCNLEINPKTLME